MVKDSARRIRLLLGLAVAIVCVLLVSQQLVTYFEERATQRRIDLVQQNALVSVRLVGKMSGNVLRQRILIDRYVYERDNVDIADLARQIDAVRQEFGQNADSYAELPMLPGEAGTWYQLMADVATA